MGKKMTHKEFLERVKIKNPAILTKVEFIEEYSGSQTKLKAKYKYGIVALTPETWYKAQEISIVSAIDKTAFLIANAKDIWGDAYGYTTTEFRDNDTAMTIICPIHGETAVRISRFLAGKGCRICSRENRGGFSKKYDHQGFLADLKVKNLSLYEEVTFLDEYVNTGIKIRAYTKYGLVWIDPITALKGYMYSIHAACDKTAYLIAKFKEKHGELYDYSLVKYILEESIVFIICPIHGVFPQNRESHLMGCGCPTCGKYKRDLSGGWSRTSYINIIGYRDSSCYIIRCYNEMESFNKIGISVNIPRRFKSTKAMPYNYEVLQKITSDPGYVYDLEHRLQKLHRLRGLKYIPKIPFNGEGECFTNVLWDEINKEVKINKESKI